MRALALLLVVSASAAAQPTWSPRPFGLPSPREPVHTSAAQAYLYAAGATAGAVGLGLALVEVLPEGDPTRDAYSPRDVGWIVVATGALVGPSVGNLTLGAVDDAVRAYQIKGVGVAAGGGLVVLAIGAGLGCMMGGSDCDVAGALFTGGAIVMGVGLTAGTVYDLATIPRNAARARARVGRPATVAVHGLGLAVRVGL